MSTEKFPVLGFDIGGTKIAICLAMSDGTVLASGRVSNKMKKPDEVLPLVVAEGRAKGLAAEFEEAEAREAAAVRAQGEVERRRPLGVRRRRPLTAGAQLAGREAREAVRRLVLGRERVAVEVREGGHEEGLAASFAADDGEARHRCQGEVVTVQAAPARRTVQKSALAA